MQPGDVPEISSLPIKQFHENVADHGTYCGGGSVAAVTAAGAASLTTLVLALAARRKVNAEHREELQHALEKSSRLQQQFHLDADNDARALVQLMEAQANLRASADRLEYVEALVSAANAPLAIAAACLDLLSLIEMQMRRANRFTVSDLGAAGTLSFGALQAAALMADVNTSLLEREADADANQVRALYAQSALLRSEGESLAERIDAYTSGVIRGSNEN